MLNKNRESFSVHFGSPEHRALSMNDRPFMTNEEARQARDVRYKELKEKGENVKRSVLKGQLRQYWGFMDPCGIVAPVYEIYYKRN